MLNMLLLCLFIANKLKKGCINTTKINKKSGPFSQ